MELNRVFRIRSAFAVFCAVGAVWTGSQSAWADVISTDEQLIRDAVASVGQVPDVFARMDQQAPCNAFTAVKPVIEGYSRSVEEALSCERKPMGCTAAQVKLRASVLRVSGIPSSQGQGKGGDDLPIGFGKSYFIPNPFNGGDALLFGITAAAGGLAFSSDQKIMNAVQANKPAFTNILATMGNDNGQYAWIPVAAGLLGGGYIGDDDKAKETGFMILAASAATGLVAQGGKNLVGRERPYAGKGPYDFGTSGQSFPSGHTTEDATFATVIAEEYGDHEWVAPVAYASVALTAYARMHDQAHWMSDTVAGFALGHFGAKYMMKILKKDGTSYPGLLLTPKLDPINREYTMDVSYVPRDKNKPMECSSITGDIHAKIQACIDEAFKHGSK